MRSSKRIIASEEADQFVLPFEVKKFPIMPSEPAQSFVKFYDEKPSSFQINPLIAEQSGISNLQRKYVEEQAEKEALEKIKAIQEEAYREAYQLGLEEGQKQAYQEVQEQLQAQMASFETSMQKIEAMKYELLEFNEAHLLKLLFFFSSRLAKKEVQGDPEIILSVLKECIRKTQEEENIRIQLSPEDYKFIEENKAKLSRDFDFLKKTTLEVSEEIASGGCVIETNYGSIDATLETRAEKLWEAFIEKLPFIKDKLGA